MRRIALMSGLIIALAAPAALASVCTMTELDTINPGGSITKIKISGMTAYVAAGREGIGRIDITNAEDLELIDFIATQDEALDLIRSSIDNVLVVADGNAGIGFYTEDGAGSLIQVTTLDLGERIISVDGLAARYLAGGEDGTLYTVLFDGASATIEGSVSLGGPVNRIDQNLDLVYCALGSAGLGLVDVDNRTSPTLLTALDLGGAVMGLTSETGVLYCGVEGIGLVSVATSNSSMWPLTSLSLDVTPYDLISWGGRIYMAAPDAGVLVADASLGDSMLLLGELELSGAVRLGLTATTLYVGRGSTGLSTVDATNCGSDGQVTAFYIPASARAVGTENTFWVTDVAIGNLTSSSAVVNIAYLEKDKNNSTPLNQTFALESQEQLVLADVYDRVFSLESGNGGLRITTSHPDVKSTSRTYNAAGATGTYGQFIPAMHMNESLAPGVIGVLLQLQENDGFRTNIGLLNRTSLTILAQIDFFRDSGNWVRTRKERLVAYEMTQFNVQRHTGDDFSGYAVVQLISCAPEDEEKAECPDPEETIGSADDRVFAYASVVDNNSGDPIYIMPQKLTTGSIFD